MKEKESRLLIPLSVLGLYAVAFGAFGQKVKDKVKKEQGGRCASCGSTKHLQCHHIVPKSLNGTDDIANAVYLCGESSNDCHEVHDNLALTQGIIYPGIPIEEAPDKLFRKGRNPFKKTR